MTLNYINFDDGLMFFTLKTDALWFLLQEFKLNYSRSYAIQTRKIISEALVAVIQAGLREKTHWNVKVIMAQEDDPSTSGKQQSRRSCRLKKKSDIL